MKMKYIFMLMAATVICTATMSQKIGSKVSLTGVDGKNYTGIITDIQGGKYKVKYDAYDFNAWLTQRQFVVTNTPATRQNTFEKNDRQQTDVQKTSSSLSLGQYATYGYGGGLHLISGMGFILLGGGNYYDLHKGRGGKYVYIPGEATISFSSGFLGGQVGKLDNKGGFWLSKTVYCGPWK